MAFCSKCGTLLSEDVKFCPKCGQPTNVATQQQVNNPQQYVVSQEANVGESKLESFRKSKWNWIAVPVLLICFIAFKFGGSSDTEMLEKEVKQMMIDTMKKKGQTMTISDFTLVHKSGNDYTGIANCTLDGEKMDLDVNVVYDGSKFQAEWAPTAEYQQKALEKGLQELFGE